MIELISINRLRT